jgi:peroxiredoxin
LRETYHAFQQRGAAVLVVSSTDVEMTSYVAEVLRAPYPILSDASWSVFQRYGVGSLMGVPLPGVFLIDSAGILRWQWVAPLALVFEPPAPQTLLEVLDSMRS